MPDLKTNLKYQIKKHHLGKDNAITIRDLISELLFLKCTQYYSSRQIRKTLRELNLEEVPILTSIHPPLGVYWASSESEIEEYLANLGSRARAIHQRMAALSKIKAREFLRGQLEMFT
jgi:hypothetical protein